MPIELVADTKGGGWVGLEDGIFFTMGCWDEKDGITKLGGGEISKLVISELVECAAAGDELENGVESPNKSTLGWPLGSL